MAVSWIQWRWCRDGEGRWGAGMVEADAVDLQLLQLLYQCDIGTMMVESSGVQVIWIW